MSRESVVDAYRGYQDAVRAYKGVQRDFARDEARNIKRRQREGYSGYGDYAPTQEDSDKRRFRQFKESNRVLSRQIRRMGRGR